MYQTQKRGKQVYCLLVKNKEDIFFYDMFYAREMVTSMLDLQSQASFYTGPNLDVIYTANGMWGAVPMRINL